jgi:cyclophilin family peptidyl-prolyl cis-trans isomerase
MTSHRRKHQNKTNPNADIVLLQDEIIEQQQYRRTVLKMMLSTILITSTATSQSFAFPSYFTKPSSQRSLYTIAPMRNSTSIRTTLLDSPLPPNTDILTPELCLLRLLPVKNTVFRQIQTYLESLSFHPITPQAQTALLLSPATIESDIKTIRQTILTIDKKRSNLQPVFDPELDTVLQILKNERFEILIEQLRNRLVQMESVLVTMTDFTSASYKSTNTTDTLEEYQKSALLTLSRIGELLVQQFPYNVPTQSKYSYLPRLLGRCEITFGFKRRGGGGGGDGRNNINKPTTSVFLGNVTVVADGYTAPITAGNFVDLCIRQFYTGLPVKFTKRRVGGNTNSEQFDVANLPVLGSYGDGFYDPLTAKPRRLPLEIVRLNRVTGQPDLTYPQDFLDSSASLAPASSSSSVESKNTVMMINANNDKPLVSFEIPGILAMNHPEKNFNAASSEFFGLQSDSMAQPRRLLDGEYAPFAYIIDGMDVFNRLRLGDVIDSTTVDEFGAQANLVKLRRSSFSEVVQGSGGGREGEEARMDPKEGDVLQ